MNIKEKTRKELDERIRALEGIIARKGVGASYRQKIDRIQRDVNIALMLGATSAILGFTIWTILKSRKE